MSIHAHSDWPKKEGMTLAKNWEKAANQCVGEWGGG